MKRSYKKLKERYELEQRRTEKIAKDLDIKPGSYSSEDDSSIGENKKEDNPYLGEALTQLHPK